MKLIKINADEFIKQVLIGERDFTGIDMIRENLSNNPNYQNLLIYLITQDLENEPLVLSESRLSRIEAIGLYAPHTIAENTQFYKAWLNGADFQSSNFKNARFGEALLRGTNMSYCNFKEAYLRNAQANDNTTFTRSNFTNAKCMGMNARYVDLSYVNATGANWEGAVLKNSIRTGIKNLVTSIDPEEMSLGNKFFNR